MWYLLTITVVVNIGGIMQFISRSEQERVIETITQEYDIIKENIENKAWILGNVILQIEKFLRELADINKDRFFEEDLRKCIDNFATKLASYLK